MWVNRSGSHCITQPRLGLSQDTDTSKNTKATLKCCYALHSYDCGDEDNHTPETDINPPKTACSCPCGRVKKKNCHTRNPHSMCCIREPRRDQEAEGGARLSKWVELSFVSGFNSCFLDTVFVTLLHTAVETEIRRVYKLLCTSLTVLFR